MERCGVGVFGQDVGGFGSVTFRYSSVTMRYAFGVNEVTHGEAVSMDEAHG